MTTFSLIPYIMEVCKCDCFYLHHVHDVSCRAPQDATPSLSSVNPFAWMGRLLWPAISGLRQESDFCPRREHSGFFYSVTLREVSSLSSESYSYVLHLLQLSDIIYSVQVKCAYFQIASYSEIKEEIHSYGNIRKSWILKILQFII